MKFRRAAALNAPHVRAEDRVRHLRVPLGLDRVPRVGESYVKDFLPWRMGRIQLTKGRGKLVLRATEIPGKQVADVRYIAIKRI